MPHEDRPILFYATSHPAGHGAFISILPDVYFRLTRQNHNPGEPHLEASVLEGIFDTPRIFFDSNTTVNGPTVYRLYLADAEGKFPSLAYAEARVEPEDILTWNPVEDAATRAANSPRDALIVYLSARLAQLVKTGRGAIFPKRLKDTVHANRFPVKAQFEFTQSDMPVVAVDYGGGTGGPGDLGWNVSEENVKLTLYVAAGYIEERDATTRALRAVLKEIDWFLESMGCSNITYGEFQHYIEDRMDPPIYVGQLSLGLTVWSFQGVDAGAQGWELIGGPSAFFSADGRSAMIMDDADGFSATLIDPA